MTAIFLDGLPQYDVFNIERPESKGVTELEIVNYDKSNDTLK